MPTGEAPRDRPPTSHERQSGRPWDASYQDGPPPWDLDEPQPAVVRLAETGGFSGQVLDAGCGTGENALYLAARGLSVFGVDVSATAVATANRRATARGFDATFTVGDALRLPLLARTFRTVLDCGLFHTFDATERADYASSLAGVVEPGGTVHILCFSDTGPTPGPHPMSRAAVAEPFESGVDWQVVAIEPETLRTRFSAASPAWLATVRRRPS
ncbi:class I SAM-dependent methyltransferase [Nocardia neocaledoniensis]|uniref:class I SAM-dependent methyltransferase n=1 Tax=Nocardia neocaledoniensis TaxID=236511 RepID=UPI002456298C|nr:class I SAM-dependent methyltransferase [Nocardia neocaledoniensis]